jgi:hypothetical protein
MRRRETRAAPPARAAPTSRRRRGPSQPAATRPPRGSQDRSAVAAFDDRLRVWVYAPDFVAASSLVRRPVAEDGKRQQPPSIFWQRSMQVRARASS